MYATETQTTGLRCKIFPADLSNVDGRVKTGTNIHHNICAKNLLIKIFQVSVSTTGEQQSINQFIIVIRGKRLPGYTSQGLMYKTNDKNNDKIREKNT